MTYRADIDGLRSIAVLLVVFFHFGIGTFSGGYVGVDVFFVLSGFLISSLIFRDLETKRFTYRDFYFRRIRRLAPVYFVVMGLSCVVAYLIMLPSDFKEFGQSLFASAIYLSNILFYMESGYFDSASHVKPLLHTWSLSVEEQFYIIFPTLALVLFKFGRKIVVPSFIALTLLSLVAAEAYIRQDQSAVFYLYPFRAWEMFLGSLLALKFIPVPNRQLSADALSILGVVSILTSGLLYTNATPFPGVAALLPCLGTVALILSGYSNGFFNRLLATNVPVFIGKISYSMYLWHWPVYVFYAYYFQHEPEGFAPYTLLLITTALSYLSWKYIETPFRSGQVKLYTNQIAVFASTALITMACLGFGIWLHITNGVPSRLSTSERDFAAAAVLFEQTGKCLTYGNEKLPNIAHCAIGDPYSSDNYTLVWGDSHAGAYAASFRRGLRDSNKSVVIAWAGGCPPVAGIYKQESFASETENKNCQKHVDAVLNLLSEDAEKIDSVIIAGRWSYYLNGGGVGRDASNQIKVRDENTNAFSSQPEQAALFISALEKTLRNIASKNINVFFIEQPPEIEHFHARTLAVKLKTGQETLPEVEQSLARTPVKNVLDRQHLVLDLANRLESEDVLQVVRTHQYLCHHGFCSAFIEGRPVYFDNNHITASASDLMEPVFNSVLSAIKEQN